MASAADFGYFKRKSLDQITEVPDSIISVYVIEQHVWADGGSETARAARTAETRTVDEFLVNPVRPFLNDVFRQMAAPYTAERNDNPIGQGYWIQAEFGSGKSHLLSFVGALALGKAETWEIVREKEREAGQGRRDSLYNFYENGLAKKTEDSKGILVAVKTLVGEGGGTIGLGDSTRNLTEYVLDAVADQFYRETGRSLPFYPVQLLSERFVTTEDFVRYKRDLVKFLKDPAYFDEEEQQDAEEFLDALQNNPDPAIQKDCGQRLWDFYNSYLQIRPRIPMEAEDVLENMMRRLLDEGYAGLLLILDEISLFMKGRDDAQRVEDEKALVVLSNRLAKVKNLPIWTVCAAQEAIETKMAGIKNIIARERLDLVPLLNDQDAYYDIALQRVRTITDPAAIDQYYEDYKRSFSWPQSVGRDEFARFFPYYPPSIDIVRAISYRLTTVRSALYFMLQTLKTQRKRQSNELITLWALFDDVIDYEEDPSGTTKGIANVKTKWPEAWRAYESGRQQLNTVTKGALKVYRNRCEKVVKTLFLYHVADRAPNGLGFEELMNSVMEWKDHNKEQEADLQDNLDHYGILADQIAMELPQVEKIGNNYKFNPTGEITPPSDHFAKARAEVESDEVARRRAWESLLALDGWEISTSLMTLDLGQRTRSIFREIAPGQQKDVEIKWHGRMVKGRVYMRDLLNIASRNAMLPSINSHDTGLDYAVYVSSTPALTDLDGLVAGKKEPRVLFWSPDELTPTEQSLLVDFAAYQNLVAEFSGRDTEEARIVLEWVQNRLRDQMGSTYRIVPDSFGRGRIAAQDHTQMDFSCTGELPAILTPLVTQVLDTVYASRELVFDAPAPFDDTNATNVINGIVKVGKIPRGAKPNRDISAAQNYGFALQIMRRPNDRQLDLSECRYTDDVLAWIEEKLDDAGDSMLALTLYKNFMGTGGPGGVNYGLSKRMVQLYLLCLVQQGKVRVSLTGKSLPAETIDYTNIASIDFKVSVLDAIERIQRVQAPEGWDVLAPYAAVLLEDESLTRLNNDAGIQNGVERTLQYRQENSNAIVEMSQGLDGLFADLGWDANPVGANVAAWAEFLTSSINRSEPIAYLRNALDKAFTYRTYADDRVSQDELDDLTSRRNEIQQLGQFYSYRERLRAAARYARADLPDLPPLRDIRAALLEARQLLKKVDQYIGNEAGLRSELLEPVEEAIEGYKVRYLQVFDNVTGRAEEVRQPVENLSTSPSYRVLSQLARVAQLGEDVTPQVTAFQRQVLSDSSTLTPTPLTRAEIERALSDWPQPPKCQLSLENAVEWQEKAGRIEQDADALLRDLLLEKARLLNSDALRQRLQQGKGEEFIDGLLATTDAQGMAQYLLETMGDGVEASDEPVVLLTRYLQKLSVKKVPLAKFRPSKRTLEREDVDSIVDEFRTYLLSQLQGDEDETPS